MVQYHLQKLNKAGKATYSLVPLHAGTMKLNDSKSLAGIPHQFLPWWQIQVSIFNSRNARETYSCKRKGALLPAFAVEKDDMADLLVLKFWDESFAHIATNQKAAAEQGWFHWTTTCSSIWKFNWQASNSNLPYLQHLLVYPWHTRHPEVDWQAF